MRCRVAPGKVAQTTATYHSKIVVEGIASPSCPLLILTMDNGRLRGGLIYRRNAREVERNAASGGA
jgi:hypothetical protein